MTCFYFESLKSFWKLGREWTPRSQRETKQPLHYLGEVIVTWTKMTAVEIERNE